MCEPIVAYGVRKTFAQKGGKPVEVLKGVDIHVGTKEMVAIVGPSGSGKSTLLHCLSGLESPTEGTIKLAGHDIVGISPNQLSKIRRAHAGFIFQSYNLISSLSAIENVSVAARLSGAAVAEQDLQHLFAKMGLAEKQQLKPVQLSGGEQQRVSIARALATNADIIFADEPTGALDAENTQHVLKILRNLVDVEGRSVLLVTHDLEAAALADRVLVFIDGTIKREMDSPSPKEILAAFEVAK